MKAKSHLFNKSFITRVTQRDMTMLSFQLTRIILVVVMFLCGNIHRAHAADCKMEDFPVQPNFDEDRYQGKWYEVSWILQPWIPAEWNYYDFIHNYTKTPYGSHVYAQGRWPINATTCDTAANQTLYSTEESGKYIYEYMRENEMVNASHWVVDTDYDNYALVIGCRQVAPNGTCIAPEGWLWTRCPNPPAENVTYMENKLSDFCLTKGDFFPTGQRVECRADIPASCPAPATPTDAVPPDAKAMASASTRISMLVISLSAAVTCAISPHP